ncbi:hypothetical protein PIIN_05693 [Serendipita indica DSM 11827]|uniref:Uncharacterized protein n=1 Tax=Serendipita indica (strain DSM 11827) TaxID=1109443 RepID=G4TKA6_SERID|nr:hypothetical protein PIIN_05693 [Serendipita indica DSM 11827]
MSDSEDYASPPTKAPSKKRKLSTKATSSTKAKRVKKDPFADAKDAIRTTLASPDSFALPEDDGEIRRLVVGIAEYAQSLESITAAANAGRPGVAHKTAEEIAKEAERIATMINNGVRKQMPWKSTCKQGHALYVYDGVCTDPRVFGAVLGLDGPPTFKAKKYTINEFQACVGQIRAEVRYDSLVLTSGVNVRWNGETGQFKISGKYGVLRF